MERAARRRAIAFLPDPKRRYEGVPLAEQLHALERDELLEDYLWLSRELGKPQMDDERREVRESMRQRLESWLELGGRGDKPCPCNSGKRYRNCCSKRVREN